MNYSYIIIDDDPESILKAQAIADSFSELTFLASATNYTDGLNLIVEYTPKLIFIEIDPNDKTSDLSLALINELYRYLKNIPQIIITTTNKELAFDAIQYQVTDYILKPLRRIDLVRLFLKLKKSISEEKGSFAQTTIFDKSPKKSDKQNPYSCVPIRFQNTEQPLVLGIKSYGDYRYIDSRDICYLQADNNSTDIHLDNGQMITAFKTLKHFEGVLPHPFVRIHNSYIVNCNYISRIHTGNAVCYIKNTPIKLPFSKSYKGNVEIIISDFANGNYLEI